MGSPTDIQRSRIRRLLEQVIWPATHPASAPLAVSISRLPGEPVPPDDALSLTYSPLRVGEHWGGAWSTSWFRATGEIPEHFGSKHVVARVDLGYRAQVGFGGEGLVFERVGDGTRLVPRQGVNPKHDTIEVASSAEAGAPVEVILEAAANPGQRHGPLEWPMLMPDYEGAPLYRLRRFDLAVEDDAMMQVLYDWTVLTELVDALGADHRRSAEILDVLDSVALGVDLHDMTGTISEQRSRWESLLDRASGEHAHHVTAVGHAHIDSAWLWPVRETRRKCARTFSTVLRLMERYPELVFVCSQAQQHAWMEEHYPSLFAEMKEAVAAGRFEPVGSMWVEPDTNLPSGESLARQLIFGKRWFLDRYGVETVDCWLPDAFGYSGNLPQILQAGGVSRFFTQKLSWNDLDPFPHHTFWWEGIDGSRVLAHCPPTDTYNGEFDVAQLVEGERRYAQHAVSDRSLYVYGYGDGGGGPTEEMLERARRLQRCDPVPEVRLGTARGFFDAVEAEARERDAAADAAAVGSSRTSHSAGSGGLPVWTGEMYFERHRGVQTTQARGKLGNRRSEVLLREAELWAAAAFDVETAARAAESLAKAWQTVLLLQFHDILPGSSIHWVHDDALAAYGEVEEVAGDVIAEAAESLAARVEVPSGVQGSLGSVLVLNAATGRRSEPVAVDLGELGIPGVPVAALDARGGARPVQVLDSGIALVPAEVPGSGWSAVTLLGEAAEAAEATAVEDEHAVRVEGLTLSNGLVSVTIDEDGLISSLLDVETGREAIAPGARGNLFQLHHDLPNDFDAWDVDLGTFARAFDQVEAESVEVIEHGPVRAAIRVSRRIGRSSTLTQDVRLATGSRRVEFATEVRWEERHRMLKVAFPLAVRSPHATYEVQFGHVERPTHANTSWDVARFEVPAQRWAALDDGTFAVGLLNDCKYGYDVRANVMRLSLLRGPGWPDPEADAGVHRFSYAVVPSTGGTVAQIVAEAEAFNIPLRVVPVPVGGGERDRPSEGCVTAVEGAALSAVKRADDGSGDLVVRCYESAGTFAKVTLQGLPPGAPATRVDLLERPVADDPEVGHVDAAGALSFRARPFELVTLRFAGAR
jgi:alpha-mannosidase